MENASQKHRSQSVESSSADISSPSHRTQPIVPTPNSFSPTTDRAESEYHSNKRKASTSSDGRPLRSPSIPMNDPHDHKRLKNLDNTSPIRSKSPSSVHSGSSSVAQSHNSRSTQVLENIDAQAPRDYTRVSSEGASLPRFNPDYKETSEPINSSEQALGQRGILDYGPRDSPQPLPSFRLPSMSSSFPSIHSRNTSPPSMHSPSGSFSFSANSMSPSGSAGGAVLSSSYEVGSGLGSSPSPKPSFPPIRGIPQYSREVPILPPISTPNVNSGKATFAPKSMSVSSILSSNSASDSSDVLRGSGDYEERPPADLHQQHPLDQFSPALKVEDQGSTKLATIITQSHPNIGHGQFQTDEPQFQKTEAASVGLNTLQVKYPETETASEEEEEIMEAGGVVNRDQSVVSSRGETPVSVIEPSEEFVPKQRFNKKPVSSDNGSGNTPQLIVRNNKLYDVMKSEDFHLGYTVYSPFKTLPILEGKENGLLEVRVPGIYLSFGNSKVRKQAIWGTDVYTDDSDVVAALVHSGFYTPPLPPLANGDLKLAMKNIDTLPHADHDLSVTIRVMPKLIKYASTVRYRIKSREWGDHDGVSFKIESVKVLKFGEALRKGRKQRKEFIKANELMRQRVMNCVVTNNPHLIYTGLYETSVSIKFNRNNVPCYKYHPNLILALQQEDVEEASVWNLNRFEQDILCLENTKNSYQLKRVPKSESVENSSSAQYQLRIQSSNEFDSTSETDFISLQWSDIVWVDQGILITAKCEPHQIEMIEGKVIPEGILIPIGFMYWITPEIIERMKAAIQLAKEALEAKAAAVVHQPEIPAPEPEVEIDEAKESEPANESEPTIEAKDTPEAEPAPMDSKIDSPTNTTEVVAVSTEIKETPNSPQAVDVAEDTIAKDTIEDIVMVDSAAVTDEAEVAAIPKTEEVESIPEEKEDTSVQSENVKTDLVEAPESQLVHPSEENSDSKTTEMEVVVKPEERKLHDNVEIVISQSIKNVENDNPTTVVESTVPDIPLSEPEPMDVVENDEATGTNAENPENEANIINPIEVQVDTETIPQVDIEAKNDPINSDENKPEESSQEVEDGEIESELNETNEDSKDDDKVSEEKVEIENNPVEEPPKAVATSEHISDNNPDLPGENKDPLPQSIDSLKPDTAILTHSEVINSPVNGSEKTPSPSDTPALPTDNDDQMIVSEQENDEDTEQKNESTDVVPSEIEAIVDSVSESKDNSLEDQSAPSKIEEGEIASLSEGEIVPEMESEPLEKVEPVEDSPSVEVEEVNESNELSNELEAGEISPEPMDIDTVHTLKSDLTNNQNESSSNSTSEHKESNELKNSPHSNNNHESQDEPVTEIAKSEPESPCESKSSEPGASSLPGDEEKQSEVKDTTAESPKSKGDSDMEEGEIDDDEGLNEPRPSPRPSQSTYRGSDFKYNTDDFRKAGPKEAKLKEKGDKPYGFYDRSERFKERFDYRRDDRKLDRGRDRPDEYKPYRREDRPRDRIRYERREDPTGVRSRNERYDRFTKTHERPNEFKEDKNRAGKDHPDSSRSHGSAPSDNEEGELIDQPSPSEVNLDEPITDKEIKSSQDPSRKIAEVVVNEKERTKDSPSETIAE
ncbi:hypothetical protein K7432_005244 [Basidiobolus ranarum]|uniref:Uncharacterized protein n=1 Tax=Basidiobolus ranarum TaxID=34480 RepID=A0ABR2W3J6_9FUNG